MTAVELNTQLDALLQSIDRTNVSLVRKAVSALKQVLASDNKPVDKSFDNLSISEFVDSIPLKDVCLPKEINYDDELRKALEEKYK